MTAPNWVPVTFNQELRDYIKGLIESGGIGGGGTVGPPGLQGPAGISDEIIFDDTLKEFHRPDGIGKPPSPSVLAEMQAAPIGSLFMDIDPDTNTLFVWKKT